MIELRTLGHAEIRRDGERLEQIIGQRRKFALLIYLAVEGTASRDRLLSLFWAGHETEKARHSLSQALYTLKAELGEECLHTAGDAVSVAGESCRVDARQLESAAQDGAWEKVIDIYTGPFLQDFAISSSRKLEEWLSITRNRLAGLVRRAFRSIIEDRRRAGDLAAALSSARRWAEVEPLRDEAQHTLISILALAGDPTGALERYDEYRERLARKLQAEPLDETAALAERIRAGASPVSRGGAAMPVTASRAERTDGRWDALIQELKTRTIFKVGLIYLGVAWLAMQLVDILVDREILIPRAFPLALYFISVGLPIALLLAWAQEQRDAEVTATEEGRRVVARKVRRARVLALVGALLLATLPLYTSLRPGSAGEEGPQLAASSYPVTRIAVLYFDDYSPAGQLDYLADALTEHLIRELAQVSALDVAPRSAVKQYRETAIPIDSIARQLRVGTLVEGSILPESDSAVRISVQLIDARSMSQIQSALVSGSADDPFALLDTVGGEIARLLREALGVEIRLREWRAGTESTKAWRSLMQATSVLEDVRRLEAAGEVSAALRTLDLADARLSRAETADPTWVEPVVQRGWIASDRARLLADRVGAFDTTWLRAGTDHAERALALEPSHAGALELRGVLVSRLADASADPVAADSLMVLAETDLRAATEIDPSRARAWSRQSWILANRGQFREAKLAARRAYEADAFLRDSPVILFRLCDISLQLKQWEEVTRWCGEGRRRYPDLATVVSIELTALAGPEGPEPDVGLAWELADKTLQLSPEREREGYRPLLLMQVAAVLARAGLADSAAAVIRMAREADHWNDPETHIQEANVRLILGDGDRALRLIDSYLAAVPTEKQYVASDWWFEALHDDPVFQALVADEN